MFAKPCTDYNRYMKDQDVAGKDAPDPRKVVCNRCGRKVKVIWIKQSGTIWGGEPKNNWFMFLAKH